MYALLRQSKLLLRRYAPTVGRKSPPRWTARQMPVNIFPVVSRLHRHITNPAGATQGSGNLNASSVIYSEGQPPDLPDRVSKLTEWTVLPSKMGLVRQFTFPSFAAAWRFMSLVADECKAKRHHPSWHNLYNQVTVEWTTHKPLGLSLKDVEMAEFCDITANNIGLKKH